MTEDGNMLVSEELQPILDFQFVKQWFFRKKSRMNTSGISIGSFQLDQGPTVTGPR